MKQKTYRRGISMLFLALFFLQSLAQQQPALPQQPDVNQQKDYQQQMKNLQQNMRGLQKQMADLQRQHIQKKLKLNTDGFKKWNFQRLDSLQSFVWVDSLRSLSRSLSNNIQASIGSLSDFDDLTITGSGKKLPQEKMIEKTKTFSKSYPADKNEKLTINNQYGKITVNTWNKKEFKVDVEITVGTSEDTETQKLLDAVDIVSSQDQDGVSFKTNITEQNKNNGFFSFGRSNVNRKITINYTVFMPVKNALDITNRYGAVVLPDLEGPVMINSSYGSFTAKELSNTANDLKINYGSANIESLNGGNLKFNYGDLKIGTANNLNAAVGYSPVRIERLKTSANINVNYGAGLTINNLDKTLKSLAINANYTKVLLDLSGSENFGFDVTVHYSQFNHNDDFVKIQDQPEKGTRSYISTRNYKGYVGKSGSDNKVVIRSNYSGVNFN
ncbi:hypothetical protein [Mucilaginibacter sp.]|uniref:hypothetical protein n=1 Tax=Mucilaginibacter sp. TaxID=1882438 RepID=UPI003B00D045